MKYVILKKNEAGGFTRVFPVIFPEHMVHSIMARAVADAHFRATQDGLEISSAGFCAHDDGSWVCFRGSESLNIPKDSSKDAEDAKVLNMPEALQGIVL